MKPVTGHGILEKIQRGRRNTEHLWILREKETDPVHNLAAEKVLADTSLRGEITLYLWQNRRAVIVGRNQNLRKECRSELLAAEGGIAVRRLSGGGAVYHDLGNLNYSFCCRDEDSDPERFLRVVLAACRSFGIPAELNGRNDLTVGGRKFSGCSACSSGGSGFFNGTLLLNADPDAMDRYLRPSPAKLEGKGVDSVRSRVVNLSEFIPGLNADRMSAALAKAFSEEYGLPLMNVPPERFSRDAMEAEMTRFSSPEWNYGRSFPFDVSFSGRFRWGEITVQMSVRKGRCTHAKIFTDAMEPALAEKLGEAFRGREFSNAALCAAAGELPDKEKSNDLCALIRAQEF